MQLESFIRKTYVRREHVVTVFVDQKAYTIECYDMMWKNGILRDLFIMPTMNGRLPQLILKFAPDRQFRVRVGSCLSDAYSQEMGVSKEVSMQSSPVLS